MNAERDNLLSKINKLLALAGSNHAGEADAAAAKALELQMTYNIQQAELNSAHAEFIRQDASGYTPKDPAFSYISKILRKFYAIRVVRYSDYNSRFQQSIGKMAFMGEAHNVEIAEHMSIFLTRSFHSAWREYQNAGRRQKKKNVQHDFFQGIMKTLFKRLEVTKQKVEKATGKDLIVTDKALAAYLHSQFPLLRSSHRRGRGDAASILAGQNAGEAIRLQRAATHSSGSSGRLIS